MADATGEAKEPPLRVAFERRIKLEFHGARPEVCARSRAQGDGSSSAVAPASAVNGFSTMPSVAAATRGHGDRVDLE